MKGDAKISIIVPVYNVEKFVTKCIESLLLQSYQNIEILLIDDGSNDISGQICDKYKLLDNRIQVYHKTNGGVSSARNMGLEKATGDYIMFVDADDYVEKEMCKTLLECALKNDSDIVFSDFVYDKDFSIERYSTANLKKGLISNINEVLYLLTNIYDKAAINVCSKLFKKESINNYRFEVGTPLGEDQFFVFMCALGCGKVYKLDKAFYHYVVRDGSAMHQGIDLEKELKLVEGYNKIELFVSENFSDIFLNRFIAFRITQCEMTIVNKMICCGANEREILLHLRNYMRKNIMRVFFSNFPIWKKVQIFICAYMENVYKKTIVLKRMT